MTPLDAVDHKIIRLLKADGRLTNARLAEEVGLSPSACLRRLRMLERAGVIRGYTAIVDAPEAVPASVFVVQITLERHTEDAFRRFEEAVRKCHAVGECFLMSGSSDYLLRVDARDAADYERIYQDHLARLPGVARIQSSVVIRTVVGNGRARS